MIYPSFLCQTRIWPSASASRLWQSSLSFDHSIDLAESDYTQVLSRDHIPCAASARRALEDVLGDSREPSSGRFVWDPWSVRCGEGKAGEEAPLPGDFNEWEPLGGEREAASKQIQYSMTRAQCSTIFPEDIFDEIVGQITELGQSIGLAAITPPWISLYGERQMQNLHTDSAQGPMAWTLSLSMGYGETFTGGETVLLTPKVLDYWRDFDGSTGQEAPSLMRFLPPLFGRFVAFDPRVPHMVQRVSSAGGSLESRIMIHGWFAQPEVVWYGDLEDDERAKTVLDDALVAIMETLGSSEVGRVMGFLSVRLDVSPGGDCVDVTAVCDTLQADPADFRGVVGYDEEGREVLEDSCADVRLTLREALGNLCFPASEKGGSVIVPFDFV